MITSNIIKKFIDFYDEFKYDGRLSIEQLVFAMDNFQKISFDIEDIARVINNRDFGEYTQYNLIDFFNAVFNEQVYDLFLRDRREQKMCYWIINIEFYKIFNIYRIMILRANLLNLTMKGSLSEVTIKDFERTINIYITDSVSNVKKCLDFLKRNDHIKELIFCMRPFRNLVKMEDFGRTIFQRILPNIDPDELAKLYETDDEDEDDDDDDVKGVDVLEGMDPEVKMKLETIVNSLARLNGTNNEIVDPVKKMVRDALKKAGIDIDLDTNTTVTIGNKTYTAPKNDNSKGMNMNMSMSDFGDFMNTQNSNGTKMNGNNEQIFQDMMNAMNMMNMQGNTTTTVQQNKQQNKQQHVIDDSEIVFSEDDREIEQLLNDIRNNTTQTKIGKKNDVVETNNLNKINTTINTKNTKEKTKKTVIKPTQLETIKETKKETRGRKTKT